VLRKNGVKAPILLLSQPRAADVRTALDWDLRLTTYTPEGIDAIAAALGEGETARVHLKVDTGMNRVGCRPSDALRLAKEIARHGSIELEALYTHCAVADEPDNPFTDQQLDRFEEVVAELEAAGLRPPMLHAANSAAAIDHPRSRYDLVRIGIALYGIAPSPALADRVPLRPVMSLVAEVSMVKRVPAGEGISYGLRHRLERDTTIATIPIGYADGVPRGLPLRGGEVLIGGRRRPMIGVVTMDQLMVDCGDDDISVGDEVVLLGEQGGERVTADEWARHMDTIAYEIVCGIGPRVPRRFRR
jgi:alanine racemase